MPTKEIKKLISDKCKVITITPAAFKGYFPQTIDAQSNSINSKICEYFTWGDKFLNKFCRDGKDIKEIIKKLQSTEFLPKDKILKYINDSLENLRFTEESCDVKIADYVEANYNKRVLYFSPTHGNDEIMQVLSRRLLLSLGINERITENKSVSIVYDNHEVPVYPAVLNAIGIYSENSQRKVNCGNYFNDKTKLSFIEYIKLYYEKWQEYKDIK